MIKSMEKLKVRLDQNLHRSEKSVALPLQLLQIGEQLHAGSGLGFFFFYKLTLCFRRDDSDLPLGVSDSPQEDL